MQLPYRGMWTLTGQPPGELPVRYSDAEERIAADRTQDDHCQSHSEILTNASSSAARLALGCKDRRGVRGRRLVALAAHTINAAWLRTRSAQRHGVLVRPPV